MEEPGGQETHQHLVQSLRVSHALSMGIRNSLIGGPVPSCLHKPLAPQALSEVPPSPQHGGV